MFYQLEASPKGSSLERFPALSKNLGGGGLYEHLCDGIYTIVIYDGNIKYGHITTMSLLNKCCSLVILNLSIRHF